MKDLVFITGNQHKADYLAKWLGQPIEHQKLDLKEVQSLDLRTVVEDKAHRAYDILQRPVLVEDVSLAIMALGHLPGTFIKWFLEELHTEGLCRLVQLLDDKRAAASMMYALFDGRELRTFEAQVHGRLANAPREREGFEWKNSFSSIFIPDGSQKTYAEMPDEELKRYSHRAKAIAKLQAYLLSL